MKEDKIEYNKLCAEFLGYVNTTPTDKDFDIYHNEKGMIIGNKIHTMIEPMSAKFHSDWNWIMEVVEAIEAIEKLIKTNVYFSKTYLGEYTIEITHNEGIREYLNKTKKVFVRKYSKKEAVVQAINQFLIWYNENKNN